MLLFSSKKKIIIQPTTTTTTSSCSDRLTRENGPRTHAPLSQNWCCEGFLRLASPGPCSAAINKSMAEKNP